MVVLGVLTLISPLLYLVALVFGNIDEHYDTWRIVRHAIFFVGSVSFTLLFALQNFLTGGSEKMKILAVVIILSPLFYLFCLAMEKYFKPWEWEKWLTAQDVTAFVGTMSLVAFLLWLSTQL